MASFDRSSRLPMIAGLAFLGAVIVAGATVLRLGFDTTPPPQDTVRKVLPASAFAPQDNAFLPPVVTPGANTPVPVPAGSSAPGKAPSTPLPTLPETQSLPSNDD